MLAGSTTSQRTMTVVSSVKGSNTLALSSGIRIMSDSLMCFQPAMEEPSNILPSTNMSASTSRAGMVTCCSLPLVSVKRKSTHLASLSLISFRVFSDIGLLHTFDKKTMPEALFPSLMIRGRKRLVSENIRYFFHGERAYHDSFCRAPDFPDATNLPNFILCQRTPAKIGLGAGRYFILTVQFAPVWIIRIAGAPKWCARLGVF